MSATSQGSSPWLQRLWLLRLQLPTVPEALASLLRIVVVALFLLTFVLQPYLIPSESMERTLLVGDFLLVNRQVYAPSGSIARRLLPYREVARGDIVVFHHSHHPYVVKRVIGVPGDRLRIAARRVTVNGVPLDEPYAAFEPAAPNAFRDDFPGSVYSDPSVNLDWWKQMQGLIRNGQLVVPPGEYFVLGDNRNHSDDSRYWGFVARQQIVARPLVIYFSLFRPSTTDVEPAAVQAPQQAPRPALTQASDDRLGHDRQFSTWLQGFARWSRIFQVVH